MTTTVEDLKGHEANIFDVSGEPVQVKNFEEKKDDLNKKQIAKLE